ncbi:MAG: AAA family ATPase [Thiobacillus sp.]|nr:AAA family ATPase [Thiobacillus sp.]
MAIGPHRRRTRKSTSVESEITPLTRLWLLRILVPLGGHKRFVVTDGFASDDLAHALGLGNWINPPERDFDPKAVRTELRSIHQACERSNGDARPSSQLADNVARLSELAGLSDADCRILIFVVLLRNDHLLMEAVCLLGELSNIQLFHKLSMLLDLPEGAIRDSLNRQGALYRSGLLKVDQPQPVSLIHKFDLLSDTLADNLIACETDPIGLLRDTVSPCTPPQLSLDDYEHVDQAVRVLMLYLKRSLASARKGVNVFLYGAPGTGKSQLARVLAHELGSELFEVASEDGDGDPVSGEQRLRAYRAAQCFFAQRRSILLFDEAEDVFQEDANRPFFLSGNRKSKGGKAWINRMLETNAVPTLWLSNSSGALDPAFIRRFDMVIELPIPPQHQREKIVHAACGDMLDEQAIERFARSGALAPAVIARAASVTRLIQDDLAADQIPAVIESLISKTLEAQGHNPLRHNDPNALPETYNPAFINSDADLAQVTEGLTRSRSGRLCLYGPPGTGKTAYARWLAARMGMPLLVKRASDLQSMWLGEAEKNIARAFREAEQMGALLLIDEVDSFLQDRRNAERSWEVSQVNEMLTQMESFPGVFIASTNLMAGLDQASLRRFDLKVKFDYLKHGPAWKLLCRQCDALGIQQPTCELRPQLKRLANLTPGDYAAVARQHRFRPMGSAADLVAALEAECAVKEGARSPIGFV